MSCRKTSVTCVLAVAGQTGKAPDLGWRPPVLPPAAAVSRWRRTATNSRAKRRRTAPQTHRWRRLGESVKLCEGKVGSREARDADSLGSGLSCCIKALLTKRRADALQRARRNIETVTS